MSQKTLGLYLHVPFCKSKCRYCDFYSLPHREADMDSYCTALRRHLEEVAPRCSGHTIDTVYFGGGTPSYLGASRLRELMKVVKKRFSVDKNAEITLECNPESTQDAKELTALRKAGFNRLSFGVQAAQDELLQALGRIHTFAQATAALTAAKDAGFDNLSVDLMYGLPRQTMAQWQETVKAAAALPVSHISCYALKIEEGTPLWQERDADYIPDDDAQADMYLWAASYLECCGLRHYEISNFAREGCESRHNLKYWQMREYAGFGPGAHSDFGYVRFAYERDLDSYLAGELSLSESEEIVARERAMEYMMLSLRTADGVDRAVYEQRYRRSFAPLEPLFARWARQGLAAATENGWRLTARGFLVSNTLILEAQEAMEQARLAQARLIRGM